MSYLVLLGLYSYFMMAVQLSPAKLSIHEILVWVWALTLWLEEIRQVIYFICHAQNSCKFVSIWARLLVLWSDLTMFFIFFESDHICLMVVVKIKYRSVGTAVSHIHVSVCFVLVVVDSFNRHRHHHHHHHHHHHQSCLSHTTQSDSKIHEKPLYRVTGNTHRLPMY